MARSIPKSDTALEEIRSALAFTRLGHPIEWYNDIPSTNTRALDWARSGAPEGSIVGADFQSAGRGRQGRAWLAQQGMNLLFSLILRPTCSAASLPLLSPLAALSVTESLSLLASPHQLAIKWPNDVLLNGKKIGGILLESILSSNTSAPEHIVVLGIGINVLQTNFPPMSNLEATSLLLETGVHHQATSILPHILKSIEQHYSHYCKGDTAQLIERFQHHLWQLGQFVHVRMVSKNKVLTGRVEGIHADGGLMLNTETGIQIIYAGEVTTHV